MRRLGTVGLLAALAVVFTFSSCAKQEEVPAVISKKEASAATPEQAKKKEEIRKGVEESKKIIVARVNGSDITMYSLVKEMNAVAPKYVRAGQPLAPEITARVKKEAFDSLIFKELAVQEAIEEGMTVNPAAIEDVIIKVKARAGSEEAYKKYLEERNVNEDDLRKTIEKSHLFEMITAREIYQKIKIDDRAIRAAYEKEKSSLVTKDNPPRQLFFEEAKDFLARKIKEERSGQMIAQWNNELRKKAKIEVMSDEVEQRLKKPNYKLGKK